MANYPFTCEGIFPTVILKECNGWNQSIAFNKGRFCLKCSLKTIDERWNETVLIALLLFIVCILPCLISFIVTVIEC